MKQPLLVKNRIPLTTITCMVFILNGYACSHNQEPVNSHKQTQDSSLEKQAEPQVRFIRAQEDIERDKQMALANKKQAEKSQKPLVEEKDAELALMMQLSMEKNQPN